MLFIAFIAEVTSSSWLETGFYVVSSLLAAAGGWKGITAAFNKVASAYKTQGMIAAGTQFVQLLGSNREFLETLYTQFKAVVKAADIKDKAISDLLKQLPKEVIDNLHKDKAVLGASFSLDTLPAIDLAAIPFKDIVNDKLIVSAGVNDEILKSLVKSAREDEAASKAIDRVASILNAITGEGLNIGSKVLTGGTVSIADILAMVSGVGSAALGAKPAQ